MTAVKNNIIKVFIMLSGRKGMVLLLPFRAIRRSHSMILPCF